MKSSRQGRHHQKKQYSVMKVLFGSIMAIALAAALIGCSLGFGPEDSLPEGNIILFIGDGMGFAHVQAASRFHHGTDTGLSFQQFSVQTEMTTHAFGGVVTDSAAAATALATGRKVINGVISSSLLGGEYETILEYCMKFGKSGGLVTTTHITHATPAAFGAHTTSRGNYTDIASDYLHGSRPQVLLGGGGKGMDDIYFFRVPPLSIHVRGRPQTNRSDARRSTSATKLYGVYKGA